MKTLVLLDDQMDFITGPLSVKKRNKECVERTKIFINRNKEELDKVVFKLVLNNHDDSRFKRNGGDMPAFCVKYTPGACIEPTILKLLWRLNIPYEVAISWNQLDNCLPEYGEIVVAGMNGNTTLKKFIDNYWNKLNCSLFWPGTHFIYHDEKLFNWLRAHTQGIFEVPKRDKKTDLYVQRIKGMK